MRIAILADPIDNQYGGVHIYTRNLVEALLKEKSAHEYVLIRTRAYPEIAGVETIVVPRRRGFAALRLFVLIPRIIQRNKIDCVIEPAHFGPFILPDHIARITFIHDMTPVLFPYLHPWMSQMLQRLFLPGILRKATRVMTNSQHTTQDVVRLFPGTQNKVTTNYLGVESFALPATSQDILEQYGIMQPYVLSVATIEPRKNLDLLLDMYTRFRRQIEDPVQLVIAGKRGWKYASFFRALETHPRQGHSMVQYHFRRIAIRIRCRFTRRNGCIHVFVMVERNINSESVPHWI
jgi:glycosyltransferase involved in cell wall biosynthesis